MKRYDKAFSEILELQHPFYITEDGAMSQPSLDNMHRLNRVLGDPCRNLKVIHVAGTNGKGSCVNMLASVLISLGYKIGVYQSPHIIDCRERIAINGKKISKNDFCRIWGLQKRYVRKNNSTTYAEILVSMAMRYFVEKKVDIAIIEVGIGGLNDVTNICDKPIISVVTSVGYAHTRLLGFSLEEIARQKAGVIKNKVPVVLGNIPYRPLAIIEKVARERQAPIFSIKDFWKKIPISNRISHDRWFDLKGGFQKYNVRTVIIVLFLLEKYSYINELSRNMVLVHRALRMSKEIMSFRGRWDVISNKPLIILDICSNVSSFKQCVIELNRLKVNGKYKKLFILFGVAELSSYDVIKWSRILPREAYYVIPCSDATRNTIDIFKAMNIKVDTQPSIDAALKKCVEIASVEDAIFIGGSHYIATRIFSYLKSQDGSYLVKNMNAI